MSEQKWTPEPWQFNPSDEGDASVGMGGYPPSLYVAAPEDAVTPGDVIVLCTLTWPFYLVPCTEIDLAAFVYYGNADANGARIVACVNALAGIEDPAAFVAAYEAMRRELRDYLDVLDNAPDESSTSEIRAALRQADASLAAAKGGE
jgi:hypothetical protein